ncbi:unnamed protein product [Ectocarpus sp. CCAP 1310/34]|nr:unnamed protein product [Ectocarpus sp. CCAP 1310/34]
MVVVSVVIVLLLSPFVASGMLLLGELVAKASVSGASRTSPPLLSSWRGC